MKRCSRVGSVSCGDWVDMPALTSIQLGLNAFRFNETALSSTLTLRSC